MFLPTSSLQKIQQSSSNTLAHNTGRPKPIMGPWIEVQETFNQKSSYWNFSNQRHTSSRLSQCSLSKLEDLNTLHRKKLLPIQRMTSRQEKVLSLWRTKRRATNSSEQAILFLRLKQRWRHSMWGQTLEGWCPVYLSITEEGSDKILRKRRNQLKFLCSRLQLTRKNNDSKPVSKTYRFISGKLDWWEKYFFFVCLGEKKPQVAMQIGKHMKLHEAKNFELWQKGQLRMTAPSYVWTKIYHHTTL